MSDSNSDSLIDYDLMVQDALRSVVRRVLEETAQNGLQGEHHFFIAFKTRAPGVRLPEHLLTRFPEEMTIVLQHKFWGLKVTEDGFEVGLSFNQKPETLVIPLAAVVGFVDPSVQFALQFNDENDTVDEAGLLVRDLTTDDMASETGDAASDGSGADCGTDDAAPQDAAKSPRKKLRKVKQKEDAGADDGSNVVTLDSFRKK